MFSNPMHDIYNPGTDITAVATEAISGKTIVKVTGPMVSGLIQVAPAAAGEAAIGVAKYDADKGDKVGIARGAGRVVTITAGAAVTAGQEVEIDAKSTASPKSDGQAIGVAVDDAEAGEDAKISLYR